MASNITVSDLTILAGFGQNFATWSLSDPNINGLPYRRLKHVELWTHSTNDRGADTDDIPANAALVRLGINDAVHVHSTGAARWYWARAVDIEGSYSAWHPSSQTGGVAAAATASIGENGYVRLPSGLIDQWGRAGMDDSGISTHVVFPLAFPTACFQVFATVAAADEATRTYVVTIQGFDASSVDMIVHLVDGDLDAVEPSPNTVAWRAMGH